MIILFGNYIYDHKRLIMVTIPWWLQVPSRGPLLAVPSTQQKADRIHLNFENRSVIFLRKKKRMIINIPFKHKMS